MSKIFTKQRKTNCLKNALKGRIFCRIHLNDEMYIKEQQEVNESQMKKNNDILGKYDILLFLKICMDKNRNKSDREKENNKTLLTNLIKKINPDAIIKDTDGLDDICRLAQSVIMTPSLFTSIGLLLDSMESPDES